MEYVEGLDLARMVKTRGPLSIAHACNFVYQAAVGLQHAHERGMVHRDIKPANLILARDGKKAIVKVLDFGLAKVTSEGQTDSGLTREGQMLGTPDFIAPEQIRNAQAADVRADIYSLGCTFYYLLTGKPPFRGDHLWDIYQAHFSMEAQPLNLARPEVPVELAAVVGKMMAKEPDRRFQTPGQVAEVLVPFFKKGGDSARGSTAEISVLGQVLDHRPGSSTEHATIATKASPRPARSPAGETLQRVEETAKPETGVAVNAGRKRRWLWPAMAAGFLLAPTIVTGVVILRSRSSSGVVDLAKPAKDQVTVQGNETEAIVARSVATPSVPDVRRNAPSVEPAKTPVRVAPSAAEASAATGSYPENLPNSIGMMLKLIREGGFTMGSSPNDTEAGNDEKPAHPVKISAFYMAAHEVTQAQYFAVTGINPSYFSSNGGGKKKVADGPTGQYPVEYVTWLDAVRFCNALSERDGFPAFYEINGETAESVEVPNKRGPGYRLPTEAEWEYACRAGKDTRFSFGDDAALLSEYGWFSQSSVGMTHPVGEWKPNAFGLYDMHGNVFELCADVYDESYYGRLPRQHDDPLKTGGSGSRVIRGGSWRRPSQSTRSSARFGYTPMGREPDLGFRVVLNLSEHVSVLAQNTNTVVPPKLSLSLAAKTEPVKPKIDMLSPSTGMAFVLIKPGKFEMGSPADEVGAEAYEKPRHTLRLSPFYLGIYEVTQAQYKGVMPNNPSFFSSTGGGQEMVAGQRTDRWPVENVSWLDAAKFCNLLSDRDKLPRYYQLKLLKGDKVEVMIAKGPGYRLPTEAEWEYACRSGTSTRFYFGDDPRQLVHHAWVGGSSGGIVHAVGQKPPNGFGLYDMHGNVNELCGDWANWEYFKQTPTDNPLGPPKGNDRAHRGGSWQSDPGGCRSAWRGYVAPAGTWQTVGFRVARSLTATDLESLRAGLLAASLKDAPITPDDVLGDELIKNPGCEESRTDGKIGSWNVKQGSWARGTKDVQPLEGSAFFWPGEVPDAELSQDIDVKQLAGNIDKNVQLFVFSAYVRTWDQAPPDTCRVVVAFLGKDRSAVLEQIDSGAVASVDRWKPLEWVKRAPAQTRWIRVRLISHRQSGGANDAVYDGLSLKALKPGAKSETNAAAGPAGNVATQANAGPGLPTQGPPLELLKARGLIPSGSHFVLAQEVEALQKYDQIVPIINQMGQLSTNYGQIVRKQAFLAEAEQDHTVAKAAFDEAAAVLSKMPNGARANSAEKDQYEAQRIYRDGLQQQREFYWKAVEALRAQQAPAGVKEQLERDFAAREAEFRTMAGEALAILEKARDEHRKLEHDPVVKHALEAIRESTKAAVDLSSSRPLQTAIGKIRAVGRNLPVQTSTPNKKAKPASPKSGVSRPK